jgi:hypothetical protein
MHMLPLFVQWYLPVLEPHTEIEFECDRALGLTLYQRDARYRERWIMLPRRELYLHDV